MWGKRTYNGALPLQLFEHLISLFHLKRPFISIGRNVRVQLKNSKETSLGLEQSLKFPSIVKYYTTLHPARFLNTGNDYFMQNEQETNLRHCM